MARRKHAAVNSGVYYDSQRRTCLLIKSGDQVKFIPMDIAEGFQVHETTKVSFEQRYTLMPDYPLDKAAQLYLNYALAVGASDEVMNHLSQIITVTDEDFKMATSKRSEKPVKKPPEEKPARKRRTKKVAEEKPTRRKRTAPRTKKVESSGEYNSEAAMFQGLIMEGKLTDDEIFVQVQEAFGLDDKKRSYVTWYRNNLKKKGENPPEAK